MSLHPRVRPVCKLIPLFHRALAAAVAAVPFLGKVGSASAADDQQGVASSRMSYSRFLEYLDMGRVKKVHTCIARTVVLIWAGRESFTCDWHLLQARR